MGPIVNILTSLNSFIEVIPIIGRFFQILRNIIFRSLFNRFPYSRRKQFRRLFLDPSSDDPDRSVAIVIPTYRLLENAEHLLLEQYEQEGLHYKEIVGRELLSDHRSLCAVSLADVTATSYIVSSFSKSNLPVPGIVMSDDRAREEIDNLESDIKTFISIGLFSNSLTLRMNKMSNESHNELSRCFKLHIEEESSQDKIIMLGVYHNNDAHNPMDEERWFQFREADDHYALLSRVKYGDRTVIVCGGITEDGTENICRHMNYNLSKIFDDLRLERRHDSPPYAIVYSISRGQLTHIQSCIRPHQ